MPEIICSHFPAGNSTEFFIVFIDMLDLLATLRILVVVLHRQRKI